MSTVWQRCRAAAAAAATKTTAWTAVAAGALTCTALGVYAVADGVCAARRAAVPLFDADRVVHVDEHARYRAAVLHGCDVVVRNYYVRHDDDRNTVAPSSSSSPYEHASSTTASSSWWRRAIAAMRDDRNHVNADRIATHTTSEQASVRIIVTDNGNDDNNNDNNNNEHDDAARALSPWPAGTDKYTALVLESAAPPAGHDVRSALRALASAATHQSLLRCDARRTATARHNCVPDTTTLVAPYTRVMLGALALLPPSSTLLTLQVALLGVGGGALAGFVQRYFARVLRRVDLVDVEPMCLHAAVHDMGMSYALPLHHDDSSNSDSSSSGVSGVHVHARDATAFLRDVVAHTASTLPSPYAHDDDNAMAAATPASSLLPRRRYDVLFVDLFVGSDMAAQATDMAFLRLTRAALSPHGVVAFNVASRNDGFVRDCRAVYGDAHVLCVPVPASANVVVLARNHTAIPTATVAAAGADATQTTLTTMTPVLSRRHLYRRMQQLQRTFALPYDVASHYPVWWRYW